MSDGTPTGCRYELRSRTPNTPNTGTPCTPKERLLRAASTPITGPKQQKERPLSRNTPCTPTDRVLRSAGMASSPVQTLFPKTETPQSENKAVFRTPMTYKPRLVGNKPVPSPSRQELWKQQLGLTDEPNESSDKENSSSEDEDNQNCQTSMVEYRALQKMLQEKSVQRDESLLQVKNCKDKIRQYKARLEREESTKKQQLKIMRKTHEVQVHEKEKLINNLQSLVEEQEERLKELEEPQKVKSEPKDSPETAVGRLIEEIKRLQSEKSELCQKLSECQVELASSHVEIGRLQEMLGQGELGKPLSSHEQSVHTKRSDTKRSDTPTVAMPCCTDTEKQVEVLQAENDRLRQDLTEARNAQTKAATVSKLNSHRQQQLEDEVKRLKAKITEQEVTLSSNAEKYTEHAQLEETVKTLKAENMKCDSKIRDLQAELVSLYTKSPEVVKVTKVRQVESESLKKQFRESQEEITQLKQTIENQKEELHNTQVEVKYLQKILQKTEYEKEETESSLWKDMEKLVAEHQLTLNKTREDLEAEKQLAVKQLQEELRKETTVNKEAELQQLKDNLQSKFEQELSQLKETLTMNKEAALRRLEADLQSKCDAEISKLKEELTADKQGALKQLEMELQSKFELEISQLKEDMTIAKQAAVTKTSEELNRDKEESLKQMKEEMESEHDQVLKELQARLLQEKDHAIETARMEERQKMQDLETKYKLIVQRLQALSPVLAEFVEAYILLQREVKNFPKLIKKTVTKATKEMTAAITGISEYNKELVQKYHKEMKLRKKYHNELVELKGNIRVFCRVRPVIKEDGQGQQAEHIVQLDPDDDGLLSISSKGRTQVFEVDKVFGEDSTQEKVFDEVKALVTSCIDGYNVCIFAYGQTGSGKTYTMEGTKSDPGINQRALAELFSETSARGVDWNYSITVSMIEIYNEMIRDLLSEDTSYKMEVKMNPEGGGLYIPGLSYVSVDSVEHVNQCFAFGQQNRATASTNLNERSSRSHALLCVTVEGINKLTQAKSIGKLNLVDLAGSERVSHSKADGARLQEAKSINKSLSCLGDVIHALRSKQSYVPYRNSKLTYLLQDSLGGDSKTLMITQVAPVRKNEGETICSLNFAQRVRNIELGAATKRLENGDVMEIDPSSPARSTPQRPTAFKPGTPSTGFKQGTPSIGVKPGTTSSSSKLTPGRQVRKK